VANPVMLQYGFVTEKPADVIESHCSSQSAAFLCSLTTKPPVNAP
jgi:hypothetical protein